MSRGLAEQGYLTLEEISGILPSEKRINRGPVAVIECVQDIPCNPCEGACPFGAINIGSPITSLPALTEEKCVGCGKCIAKCPGLAIFVVDASGDEGEIMLPYEYWPLPAEGETVIGLDRKGEPVVNGRVIKIIKSQVSDKTAVITVAIPHEYINQVRNIRQMEGTGRG